MKLNGNLWALGAAVLTKTADAETPPYIAPSLQRTFSADNVSYGLYTPGARHEPGDVIWDELVSQCSNTTRIDARPAPLSPALLLGKTQNDTGVQLWASTIDQSPAQGCLVNATLHGTQMWVTLVRNEERKYQSGLAVVYGGLWALFIAGALVSPAYTGGARAQNGLRGYIDDLQGNIEP